MFEVSIEAEEFRGLRTVKQHMLVNEVWNISFVLDQVFIFILVFRDL